MKKVNLQSVEKLARKNREASLKAHAEEQGATDKRARKVRRPDGEEVGDPRYEGADRLFTEMKKKDRP